MNKKYYANIDLYFDTMKHSIVAETGTKKIEVLEMVKDFAKGRKLTCNTKTKKLFNAQGQEVGEFEIGSRII
jgi:hypothetical protein